MRVQMGLYNLQRMNIAPVYNDDSVVLSGGCQFRLTQFQYADILGWVSGAVQAHFVPNLQIVLDNSRLGCLNCLNCLNRLICCAQN